MKRLLYVAGIIFSIAGLTACSQTSKGEQMNNSTTSTSQTSLTKKKLASRSWWPFYLFSFLGSLTRKTK
mgnify:CR=1 FL=1